MRRATSSKASRGVHECECIGLSFSPLISFSIACKMHLCLVKYSVKGSFASAPTIRSTSIVVAIGWKTSRGITVATFSERMFRSVFRPGIAVMSKMLYPCGRRNFRGARFADGRLQAHVARRGGPPTSTPCLTTHHMAHDPCRDQAARRGPGRRAGREVVRRAPRARGARTCARRLWGMGA